MKEHKEDIKNIYRIRNYFGNTCPHNHTTLSGVDRCLENIRKMHFRFGGTTQRIQSWDCVYIEDSNGNKWDRGYLEAYGSFEAHHDEEKWRASQA